MNLKVDIEHSLDKLENNTSSDMINIKNHLKIDANFSSSKKHKRSNTNK